MNDAVRSRLVRGFGANAFGSVATTGIQLLMVPVLIQAWGPRVYGEWLILISLPTMLAMSDWGFENTAGGEITVLLARGLQAEALTVYQTFWVLITMVSLIAIAIAVLCAAFLPLDSWVSPQAGAQNLAGAVTLVLVVHVALLLQGGLIRAGFRATARYSTGVVHQNIARIADAGAVIVVAALGGKPIHAAIAMLGSRLVSTFVAERDMRRTAPWLTIGASHARRDELSRLRGPLLSMMAFPAGFALSLQGMIAAVGILFGPIAVATFATLRTLSRVVFQVGGIISNATLPEMTVAFAKNDIPLARTLHRRSCQAVVWVTGVIALAIAAAGEAILHLWTGGAIPFVPVIAYSLLGAAFIDALWTASSIVSLGAGKYRGVSIVYVGSTLVSLAVVFVLPATLEVTAATAALLVGTLIAGPFVIHRALILTSDGLGPFIRRVIMPPDFASLIRRQVSPPTKSSPP